jgi:tetratricopeptide (TPR) repeat protein
MPAKQKATIDRRALSKLTRFLLLATVLSLGLTPHILLANTAAIDAPTQVQSDATLRRILAEALKVASSISDAAERASAYNSIAMVEWQIGATKEAQRHFDLAHRISLQMPQDDLTCAIRQGMNEERGSVGDLEGALRNLSDCGPHSPPSDEQDNILVNMARHELKSGDFVSAIRRTLSVARPDVRDGALAYDAQIAAASGHFEEALNFTNRITAIALRITTLSQIASAYVKHGQTEKATQVLQTCLQAASEIPRLTKPTTTGESTPLEPNPDWSAYNTIAVALADTGAFPQAIGIAEQFLDGEDKEWVLMQIAFSAAKRGQPDILQQVNPQPRDPVLNAEVTAALAEALARSGDPKRALQVAEKGANLTTQASAFVALAAAAFDAGDHASAESFSEKATVLADAISDHRWRGGLFWQLARIQIEGGDKAGAVKSLSRVSPEDVGWRMLGELAKCHVRAGDIAGAIEVANHSRMISRAQLINDTASEQARLGDDVGALFWIEPLTSPDEKALALLGVAQGVLARTSPDPDNE